MQFLLKLIESELVNLSLNNLNSHTNIVNKYKIYLDNVLLKTLSKNISIKLIKNI